MNSTSEDIVRANCHLSCLILFRAGIRRTTYRRHESETPCLVSGVQMKSEWAYRPCFDPKRFTSLVLQFLSRSEVGLAALAWSVSVVLESINGLGVGYVIVRQRDLTHAELSGLFWFSTLLGAATVSVIAAVGPFFAIFYAD